MKENERKIVQILAPPTSVSAIYLEAGIEVHYPILVMALFDDGVIEFLDVCSDGEFDRPSNATNFLRFDYGEKEA